MKGNFQLKDTYSIMMRQKAAVFLFALCLTGITETKKGEAKKSHTAPAKKKHNLPDDPLSLKDDVLTNIPAEDSGEFRADPVMSDYDNGLEDLENGLRNELVHPHHLYHHGDYHYGDSHFQTHGHGTGYFGLLHGHGLGNGHGHAHYPFAGHTPYHNHYHLDHGHVHSHGHGVVDTHLPYLFDLKPYYVGHGDYHGDFHEGSYAPSIPHDLGLDTSIDHGRVPVTILPIPVQTEPGGLYTTGTLLGDLHGHSHPLSVPYIGSAISQKQANEMGWDDEYLKQLGYTKNGWDSIFTRPGGGNGKGGKGSGGCVIRIDLAFLFDIATEKKENFDKFIDFAKLVVRRFTVSEEGSRIGAVVFKDNAELQFNFDAYKDNNGVEQGLEAIKNKWKQGENTRNIGQGLTTTKQDVFDATGREDVWKVLIILTDGASSPGFEEKAQQLRDDTVNIYAIGVKGQPNNQQLKAIATDDEKFRPAPVTYDKLNDLSRTIPHVECKIDLVFVIDCGDSGAERLKQIKKFMKRTVNSLSIGREDDHVAVVTFSNNAETKWDLNGKLDASSLNTGIEELTCSGNERNVPRALTLARETFLKSGHDGWLKVTAFITDAKLEKVEETRKNAKLLRDVGSIVHAVGFGNKYNNQELQIVASSSQPEKFFVHEKRDVNHIATVGDRLAERLENLRSGGSAESTNDQLAMQSSYTYVGSSQSGLKSSTSGESTLSSSSSSSSSISSSNSGSSTSPISSTSIGPGGSNSESSSATRERGSNEMLAPSTMTSAVLKSERGGRNQDVKAPEYQEYSDLDKIKNEDIPKAILDALRDFSVDEDRKLADEGTQESFTITGVARQAVANITANHTLHERNSTLGTLNGTGDQETLNHSRHNTADDKDIETIAQNVTSRNQTAVESHVNSSSRALNEEPVRKLNVDQVKGSIFLTGTNEMVADKDDLEEVEKGVQVNITSVSNSTSKENEKAASSNNTSNEKRPQSRPEDASKQNASSPATDNISKNETIQDAKAAMNVTRNDTTDSEVYLSKEPTTQGSLKKSEINATLFEVSTDPYSSIGTTLSREMHKSKIEPHLKPVVHNVKTSKGIAKTVRPEVPKKKNIAPSGNLNSDEETNVHTDVVPNEEGLGTGEEEDDFTNDLDDLEDIKKDPDEIDKTGGKKRTIPSKSSHFPEVKRDKKKSSLLSSVITGSSVARFSPSKKASIAKKSDTTTSGIKPKHSSELSIIEEAKKSTTTHPKREPAGIIDDNRKKSFIAKGHNVRRLHHG